MLKKERGIKPVHYAKDIIWPTLALRELAKDQLTVSREEFDEAFESEFGPGVKVRLIAIDNVAEARRVHAEAVAKPEEFPALAKKYSQDPNSASAYGLIQPIRRHLGDPGLEKAAFALKVGEVSNIVKVGNLHVFVKCEEHLPPNKGVDARTGRAAADRALKDRKLRDAASDVFKQLQSEATLVIVYSDPAKSRSKCRAWRPSSTARPSRCSSWPKSASTGTATTCWKARSTAACSINCCDKRTLEGHRRRHRGRRSPGPRCSMGKVNEKGRAGRRRLDRVSSRSRRTSPARSTSATKSGRRWR